MSNTSLGQHPTQLHISGLVYGDTYILVSTISFSLSADNYRSVIVVVLVDSAGPVLTQ